MLIALLLFAGHAWATSCDDALFTDFEHPARPPVIHPRPHDREVTPEARDWAERQGPTDLAKDILAFQYPTRRLSVEAAEAARARLIEAIRSTAAFVAEANWPDTIAALDNDRLLQGSGFAQLPGRPPTPCGAGVARDERSFANALVQFWSPPPFISSSGFVSIPKPPVAGSDARAYAWASREWIRTAVEELGHVAQVLGERVDPAGGPLSRTFADERSVLRSIVVHEGAKLNEVRRQNFEREIHWLAEADIYAFMIETFGGEFVPWWVGHDSGYVLRELVDHEFKARGLPDRDWPTRLTP